MEKVFKKAELLQPGDVVLNVHGLPLAVAEVDHTAGLGEGANPSVMVVFTDDGDRTLVHKSDEIELHTSHQ